MKEKLKVAILGMGGVGGFLGGKLAAAFINSDVAEIIFIARGAHLKEMAAHGLKLITSEGEKILHPDLLTDQPGDIAGTIDVLICCVKSYDLESSLEPYRSVIGDETVILPFLNGVDATERIKKQFPEAQVWEGCVYISARLTEPGVVTEISRQHQYFFGSENGNVVKLKQVEKLFKEAGINVQHSEQITKTIWEKYFFIASVATLTSYADVTLGEILASDELMEQMRALLQELKSIANAKNIPVSNNVIAATLEKLKAFPAETTSSMHSDFKKEGKTELESLTGYVVRLGNEEKIPTPVFKKMYIDLQAR